MAKAAKTGKDKAKGKAAEKGAKDAKAKKADHPTNPYPSLVLSASLLIGVAASYGSWQGVMDGKVDPVQAATIFLISTLIAMVGLRVVVYLYEMFLPDEAEDTDDDTDASAEEQPSADPALDQDTGIAAALAATDALIHEELDETRHPFGDVSPN